MSHTYLYARKKFQSHNITNKSFKGPNVVKKAKTKQISKLKIIALPSSDTFNAEKFTAHLIHGAGYVQKYHMYLS
jgi:hypothetical protein